MPKRETVSVSDRLKQMANDISKREPMMEMDALDLRIAANHFETNEAKLTLCLNALNLLLKAKEEKLTHGKTTDYINMAGRAWRLASEAVDVAERG